MTTTTIRNGHYAPNAAGAKTLRDAKPLWINGRHVTAEVYELDGIQYLSVFFGTEISFGGKLPAEITNVADLYEFITASAMTYANVKADAPTVTVKSDDPGTIRVTVKAGKDVSAKNFGRKAAAAARKAANGRRVVRVWSGGMFGKATQTHCYTYMVVGA